MCLSCKVIDYLERSNERDFRAGRASYETYLRFGDIVDRCRSCGLFDNGRHGEMLGECRMLVLRLFVSMKRDVAQLYLERGLGRELGSSADHPPPGDGEEPLLPSAKSGGTNPE